MNPAAIISRQGGRSLAITRRGAGAMTGGRFVAGSTSALTIVASDYPLTGEKLERARAGRTTTQIRAFLTATEVFPPRDADSGAIGGDLVTIDGKSFEVEAVEPWRGPRGEAFFLATVASV